MKMMSIEEHCQKFETKVLEEQEKTGKNSRMLIKEQFDETVKRLKTLEYVAEQRNLSDFNLMRRFALLRVSEIHTQILNTKPFLCHLRGPRYIPNKMGF